MKTTLKVFAIINVVLGGLAMLEAMTEYNGGTIFLSGGYWMTNGILVLVAIKRGHIK